MPDFAKGIPLGDPASMRKETNMKTIKYLLLILMIASVSWAQTLKQNQVKDLPDSLLKKMDITSNGLTTIKGAFTIQDSASITIPTGKAGWGRCMIGDNQEHASFTFTAAGVVTLDSTSISANISTTITDDDVFIIYDAGAGIGFKNMLGSALKVAYKIEYYTP